VRGAGVALLGWLALTGALAHHGFIDDLRVAVWWNWAGIVILLNVVVHAQISAPTPWRLLHTDPPTTFIATLPYIWLPAFLVPLAWLLHAVSLRQLRAGP
jgi:hypothetical protein